MTDMSDFSFEDWLEKESQAMGEVFENMEAIPQEDIQLPEQPIEDAVPAADPIKLNVMIHYHPTLRMTFRS